MGSAAGPRIAVVGGTGAVGTVTLDLLAGRGFASVRAFASSRSAGRTVRLGERELLVEEATPEALEAGDIDLCFFSVGTTTSRKLVPHAVRGGATVIDKSDAYRLTDGVPLVVAGVNDDAVSAADRIVANPNCSAMQLTCALAPLHEAAGLARVRLATYQSMSGAGDAGIDRLKATKPLEADLAIDWEPEGNAGELSEEYKLREETRKILGLPELPLHAACMRVPVLVGHAQAVWVETVEPLSPEAAAAVLEAAPHVRLADAPTPGRVAGTDEVHVGRIRRDPTAENVLALLVVNDNLRKGAALNAVQIAEGLLARRLLPA
ncbi:MAG: aspartate-semialdehyde dehydrogenase [Thermoleophilia bacterium]|nr:aspartate-semialdehyde dehydrogenase [Thermoleophilia bacterium]